MHWQNRAHIQYKSTNSISEQAECPRIRVLLFGPRQTVCLVSPGGYERSVSVVHHPLLSRGDTAAVMSKPLLGTY